jgi:hypothetical protein
MGLDVYACATSNTPLAQQALEHELNKMDLNVNLRMCKMNAWKSTLEICTGESIVDLEWSDVSVDRVAQWATMAAECVTRGRAMPDAQKLSMYLISCFVDTAHGPHGERAGASAGYTISHFY